MAWVRARLCKLQKGCTRLAAASDKVYQLLAHGRWFSPGTPASSTTNAGRYILLKVALNTINKIKLNQINVAIINFAHHTSDIKTVVTNGVYILQLMCYV